MILETVKIKKLIMKHDIESSQSLAARITRAASKQTYYTIRLLVDRDRVADAYRAYAYFRWVDDQIDQGGMAGPERVAFVERQRALVDRCYCGDWPGELAAEERMLVELIGGDHEKNSGLQSYIRSMMAVMAFDAGRRDRLVSQDELAGYSLCLATAVTEALHFFIGHTGHSPRSEARYLAATGAHIAHMLRDTMEDTVAGYFNVPREFLECEEISPYDEESIPYRTWVRSRVELARACFKAGQAYLTQVENPRCRLAAYAYMARFEGTLKTIEKEDYRIRSNYGQSRSLSAAMKMAWSVLPLALNRRRRVTLSPARPPDDIRALIRGWP